jgi:hypothetical protein
VQCVCTVHCCNLITSSATATSISR